MPIQGDNATQCCLATCKQWTCNATEGWLPYPECAFSCFLWAKGQVPSTSRLSTWSTYISSPMVIWLMLQTISIRKMIRNQRLCLVWFETANQHCTTTAVDCGYINGLLMIIMGIGSTYKVVIGHLLPFSMWNRQPTPWPGAPKTTPRVPATAFAACQPARNTAAALPRAWWRFQRPKRWVAPPMRCRP